MAPSEAGSQRQKKFEANPFTESFRVDESQIGTKSKSVSKLRGTGKQGISSQTSKKKILRGSKKDIYKHKQTTKKKITQLQGCSLWESKILQTKPQSN